jgi:hypothetical protein
MLKWDMVIKSKPVSELVINEFFCLSRPIIPESYHTFCQHFPHLPPLIINKKCHVIFGFDFYFTLQERNQKVKVLELEISDLDGLILNYNLKSRLLGVNLIEKLLFLHKSLPLASADELYRRVTIDIPIDDEIKKSLPCLLAPEFEVLFLEGRISLKNALQLCMMAVEDRKRMINLLGQTSFTHSQQQQIIGLVEDIVFRDKGSAADLFDRLKIDEMHGKEGPQEKIITSLVQCRTPSYAAREKEWQKQLADWQLPPGISVNHFPFFEKEEIQLSLKVKNMQQLRDLLSALEIIE